MVFKILNPDFNERHQRELERKIDDRGPKLPGLNPTILGNKTKWKHGVRYIAFAILAWPVFDIVLSACIHRGYEPPMQHFWNKNVWLVEQGVLSDQEWRALENNHQLYLATTWVFFTSGTSYLLPNDFNVASNTIYAIGAGIGGQAGQTTFGGTGTGGGAFAYKTNFNSAGPGSTVSFVVGNGGNGFNTWFYSTAVLFAASGQGIPGGPAADCVGTGAYSGGNGGPGTSGPSGGGGGGAGGPQGPGAVGGNNAANPFNGGVGGTGNNGNTPGGTGGVYISSPGGAGNRPGQGGAGKELDATAGAGGGGGGDFYGGVGGGAGGPFGGAGGGGYGASCACAPVCTGGGGSGGGDAPEPSPGGAGYQGVIAIAYTPRIVSQSFNMAMLGM